MVERAGPAVSRTRALAVLVLGTVLAGTLVAVAEPEVVDGARAIRDGTWATASLESVLTWCCAAATVVVTVWVWALVVTIVVELLRAPSAPARAGGALRRLVLTACGVAVLGGVSSLAPAHAGGAAVAGPENLATPDVVKGGAPLRGPHRLVPVDRRGPSPRSLPLPDRATGADLTVRVAAGDSLWSVAADALGPDATASSIDDYWPAVYAANPGIGPDPDVLHPGDVLRLPPPRPALDPEPEERTDR